MSKTGSPSSDLPAHSPFTLWWVTGWFAIIHWFHFRGLQWEGNCNPTDRPVLLIQNHFSWWDGYWAWIISRRLGKTFNVMMLQEQIAARPFLRRCGAFPVQPGSRKALEAIGTAVQLLNDAENLVTLFPQGAIETQHMSEVKFASGIERIISKASQRTAIVMAVVLVDYFSSARPKVTIRLKELPEGVEENTSLEACYNEFYRQSIALQNP